MKIREEGQNANAASKLQEPCMSIRNEAGAKMEPCGRVLSLIVARSFDEVPMDAEEWDGCVEKMGGTLYMTWDWLNTWWEHFGRGRSMLLFVLKADAEVVGLIPIYVEKFGRGPFAAKVARLIGACMPPKRFDPPIRRELADRGIGLVANHLLTVSGCDLVSLGPVDSGSSLGRIPGPSLESGSDCAFSCTRVSHGVSTTFMLPETFEEYLDSLGSTERKNRMKRIRTLEKKHRVVSDCISEVTQIDDAFDEFVSLHRRQWESVGKVGHFEAWPQGLKFNREVTRRMASKGRVGFYRLLVDDEVASSRFTFSFGGVVYSELPARRIGDEWDRMGIGGTSMIKFNQALIGAGLRRVDSGLGAYEHKTQLGGNVTDVVIIRIMQSSGLSAVRGRMLVVARGMMLLVFDKLWYRRIAKRVPNRWAGGQREFWLRFGF